MQFRLQVTILTDDGPEQLEEVVCLERGEASLATLGLSLAEGKDILRLLQELVLTHQVQAHLEEQRPCPHCQRPRTTKDSGTSPFRTPFGKVQLPNPRWHHCTCQPQPTKTFRPLAVLLTEPTSPELLYLESKWASLVTYGVTTKLLHEVLPVDEKLSDQTVRNHLHRVAEREEQTLGEEDLCPIQSCQRERDLLPLPDGPLTVGLVQGYDTKPKRRFYEMLLAHGMQENQQVTFLSDGGDTVRELQWFLSPEAEHLLDWFHITMRLTVLSQCARGIEKIEAQPSRAPTEDEDEDGSEDLGPLATAAQLARTVESVKHYLWHGNVKSALGRVFDLDCALLGLEDEGSPPIRQAAARMRKHVDELDTYLRNNRSLIVNYGERYRNGETISTAFVESTVNQVISRRMVKKQQMRWTPRGAHLLLQVRTKVLNEDLEETFRQRYPGFRPPREEVLETAA